MKKLDIIYEDKNLLVVDNAKELNYVSNILYNKILNYHIKNGVIIFGQNNIYIDADVEIESGVIIYPNNILKGQSIIEKGVILESGNVIKDSIVSSGIIKSSYIENSKITNASIIQPFSKIINEEL